MAVIAENIEKAIGADMMEMASHLCCLLFRENSDFHGCVLANTGGLYKT